MEIWDKLDEVIGAGFLAGIGSYALYLGIAEVSSACVAGIIALLSVKAVVKHNGGE